MYMKIKVEYDIWSWNTRVTHPGLSPGDGDPVCPGVALVNPYCWQVLWVIIIIGQVLGNTDLNSAVLPGNITLNKTDKNHCPLQA